MDTRISGYFSKTKEARERTSLEHTRTDVNVEEIKHMFTPCQQKVGLNHNISVCNNYSETPDILQKNKKKKNKIQPCGKKSKFHS